MVRLRVLATVVLAVAVTALADPVADAARAYRSGDFAAAAKILLPAAKSGDPRAQYNLAMMYDNGRGVAQDDVEAVRWYRRAAEQGHAMAQLELGSSCALGQGTQTNYVEAHKWLSLAALRLTDAKARDTALKVRESLVSLMTPREVAEAERWARDWKPRLEVPDKR